MMRLTFLPSLGDAQGRSATRRPPAAMAAGGEAVAGEGKKFKIRTRTTVHRDRTESPVPYRYRQMNRTVTHGPIPRSLSTTKLDFTAN